MMKLNFEIKERYFIYVYTKLYSKNSIATFYSFNLLVFIWLRKFYAKLKSKKEEIKIGKGIIFKKKYVLIYIY